MIGNRPAAEGYHASNSTFTTWSAEEDPRGERVWALAHGPGLSGAARGSVPAGDIHSIPPASDVPAPREYHEGAGRESLVHGAGTTLRVLGANREGDDLGQLHVLPAPLG